LREARRLRVFENIMLRRTFGPKRDEVTGEWRKVHNEELNLYCSPNIVRLIKSRRIKWAGHVGEAYTGFWWGNLKERDHLGGVDGRIILNGSSGSGMWGYGLERAGSGLDSGGYL
jgi:hypothetical protein